MFKRLQAQIETALCAHALSKGATILTTPTGSKLVEIVCDQTLDLTETAEAIAKALKE